jgi:uncharacterized protein (TIGR00290 family)
MHSGVPTADDRSGALVPNSPRRVALAWSSGKDSAWALHLLRGRGDVEVVTLLTTVNAAAGRVAMHAVRESLLQMQADACGLPVVAVPIPSPCSNAQYEAAMGAAVARLKADRVEAVAFGDLFLEDVRGYRERQMAEAGLEPLFPLWGIDTAVLARRMLEAGVRARITCVDPRVLPAAVAGREWDARLLAELPAEIDPCGERGEFHTFCFAGPMFDRPIEVFPGQIVERDSFVFADLLPGEAALEPSA